MPMFKQRGNLTECVQWTGFNVDEIRDFLEPRVTGALQTFWPFVEFHVTALRHLIIVANLGIDDPLVVGRTAIKRDTWLVDQGEKAESPIGVVFCAPERFETLYEPVVEDVDA